MKKKGSLILILIIALIIISFISVNNSNKKSQPKPIADGTRVELPHIEEDDIIIEHSAYTLSYSEKHEQAEWVVYLMTRDRLQDLVDRNDNFRMDEDVPTGSAMREDYKGSGYSRGHLVPAADMKWDETAMDETFLLSNISPQLQEFNAGIWLKLEKRVRHWAEIYDSLWIVTGPVLRDGLPTIGENEVSVPEYFYKIVYDPKRGEMIGWLVPHKQIKTTAPKLAVTVNSIEKVTGLDFFVAIEDAEEERMESHICKECWNWK